MNRKIIIVITALICLCAALITAQHFTNRETENTTAPAVLTETPQSDAPAESSTEDNSPTLTDEAELTTATNPRTATSAKSTTATATKAQTTNTTATKPQTTTTTKPQTTATSATKQQTTATTTKPQSTTTTTAEPRSTETTATTKPQTTTTTRPQTTTTTEAVIEATTEAERQAITVTISINCEKALAYGADVPESGYFLAPCKYTAEQGDTVFDVLEAIAKENGIALTYQSKAYIQAIGGLAEKACGGGSGWTYKVNGIKPNKSAAKYELTDGDIIEWYYVTSPAD